MSWPFGSPEHRAWEAGVRLGRDDGYADGRLRGLEEAAAVVEAAAAHPGDDISGGRRRGTLRSAAAAIRALAVAAKGGA